jgi:hypothetical protein
MAHLRSQIRASGKASMTGLPTTGANVFRSRAYPFKSAQLPGWLVKTNQEELAVGSSGRPRLMERALMLELEGYAAQSDNVDDVLDQMALEAEQRMAEPIHNTFGGLASVATLLAVELDFDDEHEKPHGMIRLTYRVDYEAREDTPDTPG